MGHNVAVLASVNNYTWHQPKVKIYKHPFNKKITESISELVGWDKQIIVSVWEIEDCLNYMGLDENYYYWFMRGWEKWVRGEQYLINQIKKFVSAGGRIIVNSSWLIDQLREKCGVESVLCFSGLDLDEWKQGNQNYELTYTVGCLKHHRHTTKGNDIIDSLNNYSVNAAARHLVTRDNGFKFSLFELLSDGNYGYKKLNQHYQQCDTWLSLSSLEGFHQCPAEAALCGAHIIYNDIDSGGTRDYCTPETATPFKTFEELIDAIENPDFSKREKMQKVLREKIGSREKCMERFVELIS